MSNPSFFYISLKCPNKKCRIVQDYFDTRDIICDYCCADIKKDGKLHFDAIVVSRFK